ncbi:MAG: thioredoxin [Dehalococcoidia bacterium]|nr:thioredoxin [Dehalococcoidia bacterium]
MSGPITVNQANFKQVVLEAKLPVLVDFWAEWCGPCRALAPVVEELSREYSGKIDFAKVNVDEHSTLASQYGIMSIPTLIIFKKGKPAEQVVGFRPKAELKKLLDSHIKTEK